MSQENPRYREIEPDDMGSIFDVRVRTWHNPNGLEELQAVAEEADELRAAVDARFVDDAPVWHKDKVQIRGQTAPSVVLVAFSIVERSK